MERELTGEIVDENAKDEEEENEDDLKGGKEIGEESRDHKDGQMDTEEIVLSQTLK